MASKDPEEPFNTETEEETIALRKKRSRRVSFADREITSVHIFNRDEDCETPPDSSSEKKSLADEENEVLGFFRDLASDSDGSKEMSPEGDDYDDEMATRKSFLRPIESPGSSTIGSATSIDEDSFFGPVSASFIRPRRLSDSAASDDNHDITMDSTAFSMHFRSLVQSESGDIKSPIEGRIALEEKTPSQVATPSDPGSFMILTKAKKPITQTPPTADKVSGSRDSNDMSLVGENPLKYDYGRLSPTLEALLAEGSEDMRAMPIFESATDPKPLRSEVSIFSDNDGSGSMDMKDKRNLDMCNVCPGDMSQQGVSMVHFKLGEVNGGSTATLLDQITNDRLSNTNGDPTAADARVDHVIQTPNQLNKVNRGLTEVVTRTKMLNVEFPAVDRGTPPEANASRNVHRLSLFSQCEAADLCSGGDSLKEKFSKTGTRNSHVDQQLGSPLAGSVTLLSAKRKQIFPDTNNLSSHSSYATPSLRQPGSFVRRENIELNESISSLQKSISKFKTIESSLHASTLDNGLEKSEFRLPECLSSATSPSNIVVKETRRDLRYQHVDAPIMNSEKHLLSANRKNGDHKTKIKMEGDGSGSPKNFGVLNQDEEALVLAEAGESLDHPSNFISHKDKLAGMTTEMPSLGNKVMHHLLMLHNDMERKSGASGSGSSSWEITLDHRKEQKVTNDSHKNVSPPEKSLGQKLSSSVEYQGSLSGDLQHQVQHKEIVAVGSGVDGNSIEYATSGCHLTGIAEKLDSLLIDRRAQSSSPLLGNNHLKEFTRVKRVDEREACLPTLQNVSETIRNFPSPSRNIGMLKFQSGSPNKSLRITNDKTQTEEELPTEGVKASSHVPASPHVQRSLNEPSILKSPTWKELNWSPSRKELCKSSVKDSMHLLVGKDGLSSKSISVRHGNDEPREGFDNPQSSFLLQNLENSNRQKRSSEEMVNGDADNAYKIKGIQRSPKVHKSGANELESMLEHSNGSNKGDEKFGGDTTLKHWTDISHKFSTETDQIRPPLIDKLDTRAIGTLKDILLHLMKVNKYGMLCSEILSQKIYNQSSNARHKRVAETRSLLHRIVYEKAKMQIMHVKHERLLKRVQLLSSRIQKFHILKLNYVRHLSASGETDTQVDNKLHYSSLVNFEGKHECQAVTDKVTALRQEVEALDRKIKNLVKSFHTHCKMKGELSCADTIALLNDHLKKRTRCRSIRQDLQLWEIDDLDRSHGHPNLILNYNGFICQRFRMNADPVSSMVISNKLQDINIMKNFPNMDAFTAFAFVFDAESTKKFVGCKSLAQETQETSSLLHNLVTVVEEVQLARIEIKNLMQTSFKSPSVEQLDLHLSFIDFNSGGKVTMTLDMTCLNRGVYPSEILPYHLLIPSTRMQNPLPESLTAEIDAAIGSVPIGYLRIIRLCRCVSQVVQSSSG